MLDGVGGKAEPFRIDQSRKRPESTQTHHYNFEQRNANVLPEPNSRFPTFAQQVGKFQLRAAGRSHHPISQICDG